MILTINNNTLLFLKKFNLKHNIIQNRIKKIICLSVNNILSDVSTNIKKNVSIKVLTLNDKKSLNVMRHSCAHLLAHALDILYKNIKFSVGPVIKNGFYYDFYLDSKITSDSISLIEEKMNELVNQNLEITRLNISIIFAKKLFKNNKYKLDILNKLNCSKVSCYKQGSFIDLCLGPHVFNTNKLLHFKLLKLAGAYWKNNKAHEMLYRLYGTLHNSSSNLNLYIDKLNKIKMYDHKKIGIQMNLFSFYNHSPGVVFWNKLGWRIYSKVISYIRYMVKNDGYMEVNTPIMLNSYLFEKSGHMEKFNEYIFKYYNEENISLLKPMSCPCHIEIFKHFDKKSYRDLPFKISEFGLCSRNELSGTLFGLMRLKNFVQDDGHIFCDESHIFLEIQNFIHLLKRIYYKFDFKIFRVVLSKKPIEINDNIFLWKRAEKILENIIKKLNIKYIVTYEGAFYGPKLEFSLKDNIGRLWQCGTIQLDFLTPEKLNVSYIDKDGKNKIPIMLHRAILGSIERFLGILIEHKNGLLPFWITPIQVEILYISDLDIDYVKNVYNVLKYKYNVRLVICNDRLEYKIRKSMLEKIPYVLIIGKKERENKLVSVRKFGSHFTEIMSLNKFINLLKINENEGESY